MARRLFAALVVANAALAAAAPSHAASRRPATGDWEGRGASLRVARAGHATRVVDVVVRAPGCFFATSGTIHARVARGPLSARVRHGRFLAREAGTVVMVGTFGSRRRLHLLISSDQPGCSDMREVRLRPGTRVAPADGVWHGSANDGEPVYLDVAAGGRLLTRRLERRYGIPAFPEVVGVGVHTCDDDFMACGLVGPCSGGVQGNQRLIPPSGRVHIDQRSTETDVDQDGNVTVRHFYDDLHVRFTGRTTATGSFATNVPGQFARAVDDSQPPPAPCEVTFTAAPG